MPSEISSSIFVANNLEIVDTKVAKKIGIKNLEISNNSFLLTRKLLKIFICCFFRFKIPIAKIIAASQTIAIIKELNINNKNIQVRKPKTALKNWMNANFFALSTYNIIVERFFSESPAKMLIYPKYGLKNFEVKHLVEKRLEERNSIQGRLFNSIVQ